MTDEKTITTLNTIQFMLTGTAHYTVYAEALCKAKDAIREAAGVRHIKCIGRPLKGSRGPISDMLLEIAGRPIPPETYEVTEKDGVQTRKWKPMEPREKI